jgi:hypothetical protein
MYAVVIIPTTKVESRDILVSYLSVFVLPVSVVCAIWPINLSLRRKNNGKEIFV